MNQFADSLHDVFAALGRIEIKRMFGGLGVWHDGLMCALVAGGTLYLKTDAATAAHFDALGLAPFCYARQGRMAQLSYRQAPEAVFEDRQEAALWTRRAFEASLRAANAKPAAARAMAASARPKRATATPPAAKTTARR